MGYENVGKVWSVNSFAQYLAQMAPPAWCKAITLHHTGSPSLADRPKGLLIQHIHNIKSFYMKEKGWSAGPHIFIDEDEIFGMCDLQTHGVHAASFNKLAIGIEVLGNYDAEDPKSKRGLDCWHNAAGAGAVLLDWLKLPATSETVLFHRDDPLTSKKCPGKLVDKDWVLGLIRQAHGRTIEPVPVKHPGVGFEWTAWQYTAGRWCVPIYDFLVATGVPAKEVASKLKSVAGEHFYGTEPLEGSYYVKDTQKTWAPVHEVLEVAGLNA